MKTYVLTVSKNFPSQFKKMADGKTSPTFFIERIADRRKKHTIRSNYKLWEKRIKEINAGKAVLSIRYWSGRPYNSTQVEVKSLGAGEVGIEKVKFVRRGEVICYAVIGRKKIGIYQMAQNDGLTMSEFNTWFKGYDLSEPMVIIHFTNFRYKEIVQHGNIIENIRSLLRS